MSPVKFELDPENLITASSSLPNSVTEAFLSTSFVSKASRILSSGTLVSYFNWISVPPEKSMP